MKKIMAIISDNTENTLNQKEAQEKARKHEDELERLSAVLKMSSEDITSFITRGENLVVELDAKLSGSRWETLSENDLEPLERECHSFKAEARLLNLYQVADQVHSCEDFTTKVKDAGLGETEKAFLEILGLELKMGTPAPFEAVKTFRMSRR